MRVGTRIALAAGLIGAAAIGSTAIVNAQSAAWIRSAAVRLWLRQWLANLERLPAGLYGARRRLSALSRSRRRRMAHLERLSAPLYDPGWRVQAVSRLLGSKVVSHHGGSPRRSNQRDLLKELCKTRAEILPQKDRAADPISTVACNSVGARRCARRRFAALRRTAPAGKFHRKWAALLLRDVLSLHDNFGAAFQIFQFAIVECDDAMVARKHLSGNENSWGYISSNLRRHKPLAMERMEWPIRAKLNAILANRCMRRPEERPSKRRRPAAQCQMQQSVLPEPDPKLSGAMPKLSAAPGATAVRRQPG